MKKQKINDIHKRKIRVSNLFRFSKAVFFPERCPYCNKVIEPLEAACGKCYSSLPETAFERYAVGGYYTLSILPYCNQYQQALIDYKFNDNKGAAPQFAEIMEEISRKYLLGRSIDLISYVPLHPLRLKERGYNQSELLATNLSYLLCIPCENTLIKIKNNPPQHETEFKKKRENVKGAYKVSDGKSIAGKHILLIDDIITSGHTLGECATMLSEAGAESVICLTLATAIAKTT